MLSPSAQVHAQLQTQVQQYSALQAQVSWCLASFGVAISLVVADGILVSSLGAQTAWLLQAMSLILFIVMLGGSLVAPSLSSSFEQGMNSRKQPSNSGGPRYDILGRGSASTSSAMKRGGRNGSTDNSPRVYYDARSTPGRSSSSNSSSSSSSSSSNSAGRAPSILTTDIKSGAASYGSSSPRGMSTPASATPGSVLNTTFITPGSTAPAGMPTPTTLSPAINVRISSTKSSGFKRSTPERSHMFDSNFSNGSKASRTSGGGVGSGGYSSASGGKGGGLGLGRGESTSMSNVTSPAAYYSQHPYFESPASEARMSHVLDNGLMLMTKSAFHALEGHDDTRKISYGEMDVWVEGLRKVLYDHVRSELGTVDATIPLIIRKVRQDMGISRQADLDSLANLLRGLSTYTLLGSPPKEVSYSEAIQILERTFESDNEFRHALNRYKHSAVIFVPLRPSYKRVAARGPYGGGAGGSSFVLKPSPSLAQALRSVVTLRRLPTESSTGSRYRGAVSGDSGAGSSAEIIMSIFMHYWDSRSHKASNREGSSFSNDHYAASTADLHGLLRSSIAIVCNEHLPHTHYDVYSALDERDGPVILEVEVGRHNSYVAIIIFLLNIFKVARSGANSPAVQRMPASEARSVLKAICKGRYSARTLSDDTALEDYLDKFLE